LRLVGETGDARRVHWDAAGQALYDQA
jgi:hypothetical protein